MAHALMRAGGVCHPFDEAAPAQAILLVLVPLWLSGLPIREFIISGEAAP
jgi:hypothetical protein